MQLKDVSYVKHMEIKSSSNPTGLYWNDRSYWSKEDDPFSTCELEI